MASSEHATVAAYVTAPMAPYSTICKKLRAEIQATLPKAKSKMYHGLPVWFVGENAVVGFKVTSKKTVMLLFWNGQNFDEPALKASGSFEAAEIHYKDVAEMDLKSLKRWLKKAGKDIWDFAALRKSSKY